MEKYPIGPPTPIELPQRNKVTLKEIEVVFKAQYQDELSVLGTQKNSLLLNAANTGIRGQFRAQSST